MGWVNIQVSDVNIRFFSLANELDMYRDMLLQYLVNISPAVLALVIILTISTIVVLFIYSVYLAVRDFSSFEDKTAQEKRGNR